MSPSRIGTSSSSLIFQNRPAASTFGMLRQFRPHSRLRSSRFFPIPDTIRNKVFDADRVRGRIVAALDGIEVLSSYSRHCDSCMERRVTVRKAGVRAEQIQYYHRAAGCQIVNGPVKTFLALEWLMPGEGRTRPPCCWTLFTRRHRSLSWPRRSVGIFLGLVRSDED